MNSYSRKIIFNRHRVGIDGITSLYLRITIARKSQKFPLDLRWPVQYFDEEKSLCKERFKEDQECHDNNIIIMDALSKANDIYRFYRISKQNLTLDRFKKEWETCLSNFSLLISRPSSAMYPSMFRPRMEPPPPSKDTKC